LPFSILILIVPHTTLFTVTHHTLVLKLVLSLSTSSSQPQPLLFLDTDLFS
jgi:hypothetical protein